MTIFLVLQGNVFNPLMMCIDVEDPEHAIFFENVIPPRDLVAFGATHSDEMNTLLRQVKSLKDLYFPKLFIDKAYYETVS